MKFHKPAFNQERTKKRFLLFPKRIKRETRWLETAKWREYYDCKNWIPLRWEN